MILSPWPPKCWDYRCIHHDSFKRIPYLHCISFCVLHAIYCIINDWSFTTVCLNLDVDSYSYTTSVLWPMVVPFLVSKLWFRVALHSFILEYMLSCGSGSSLQVSYRETTPQRNKNENPVQIDFINLDQALGSLIIPGDYCQHI